MKEKPLTPEPDTRKGTSSGMVTPTKALLSPVVKPIIKGNTTNIIKAGSPNDCMSEISMPAVPEFSITDLYSIMAYKRNRILGFKPYLRACFSCGPFTLCCMAKSTNVKGKAIIASSPDNIIIISKRMGQEALRRLRAIFPVGNLLIRGGFLIIP